MGTGCWRLQGPGLEDSSVSRRTGPQGGGGVGWGGLLGSCPLISPLPHTRPSGICRNVAPVQLAGQRLASSASLYLAPPPPADGSRVMDAAGSRKLRPLPLPVCSGRFGNLSLPRSDPGVPAGLLRSSCLPWGGGGDGDGGAGGTPVPNVSVLPHVTDDPGIPPQPWGKNSSSPPLLPPPALASLGGLARS